jgi:hypothetical protein
MFSQWWHIGNGGGGVNRRWMQVGGECCGSIEEANNGGNGGGGVNRRWMQVGGECCGSIEEANNGGNGGGG